MKIENKEQYLELFPSMDHWIAFCEMVDKKDGMVRHCLSRVTNGIRQHFINNPSEGWSHIPIGDKDCDTAWYLTDFGPDSLCLIYGWRYELQLRPNRWEKYQSLELSRFDRVKSAFARIDRIMSGASIFMEKRNFSFELPNDGQLSERELVWAAARYEDKFVRQAVEKIERFTKNADVTQEIYELNQIEKQA